MKQKKLNNGTECRNISDGLTESRHKDPAMAYHLFCIEYLYTCHNAPVRVSEIQNSFSLCLQLNQLQTRKDNTETKFAH